MIAIKRAPVGCAVRHSENLGRIPMRTCIHVSFPQDSEPWLLRRHDQPGKLPSTTFIYPRMKTSSVDVAGAEPLPAGQSSARK